MNVAIGAFVDRFRFNALAFDPIAAVIGARPATVVAVLAGLGVSVFLRARLRATHPEAWAWPMAAALVFSPVIYPWYLVWLVPFLFDRSTLPLLVWTIAIMPTYLVWGLAREGHPWTVPNGILAFEYGAVGLALVRGTIRQQLAHRGDASSSAPTEYLQQMVQLRGVGQPT